jgi:hypothetical protein
MAPRIGVASVSRVQIPAREVIWDFLPVRSEIPEKGDQLKILFRAPSRPEILQMRIGMRVNGLPALILILWWISEEGVVLDKQKRFLVLVVRMLS